jgi:cobalamin biosynthesis protein CobD/CbiB
MDERQSARAEIDDSRERMKDIAAQLARRAQPEYVKQRAREAAVEKSMELKDRIIDSPLALGIIGGLATAGIAKVLLNQQARSNSYQHRRHERTGADPARLRAQGFTTHDVHRRR